MSTELSNVLVLCDINREEFSDWKKTVEASLVGLQKWVELPSFRRILMVFKSVYDAQNAEKQLLESFENLHLFYGPEMHPESGPQYLALPDAGRLWFTSPPASPPEEWVQTVEEEPNKQVNFDQEFNNNLTKALLQHVNSQGNDLDEDGYQVCILREGDELGPRIQVELSPGETVDNSKPLARTAMPP